MIPLTVLAGGMTTGVGLTAPAACAAIRCALDAFAATRFIDQGGQWINGCETPLQPPVRGRAKLIRMAAMTIRECLEQDEEAAGDAPLRIALCLAEPGRPGRFDELDGSVLVDLAQELGRELHAESCVICEGRVGGVRGVAQCGEWIEKGARRAIVVGSDSYLNGATLVHYEEQARLLTSLNSNGFIPGDGAAAVLLGPAKEATPPRTLRLRGVGFGVEKATIESEEPLRGDGLTAAFRAALADGKCTWDELHFRITDNNGEQYGFKEATLALARTLRPVRPEFDIWHPADCIGEVGAAIVPAAINVALTAVRKEYALGTGVLIHCSNDDGVRAALTATSHGDER